MCLFRTKDFEKCKIKCSEVLFIRKGQTHVENFLKK